MGVLSPPGSDSVLEWHPATSKAPVHTVVVMINMDFIGGGDGGMPRVRRSGRRQGENGKTEKND